MGAQKRSSLATARMKGLFVREGRRALERDVLARCVYPDAEQKHTYTPESEPSDGLVQGHRRGYPGIRLFVFTALACM